MFLLYNPSTPQICQPFQSHSDAFRAQQLAQCALYQLISWRQLKINQLFYKI